MLIGEIIASRPGMLSLELVVGQASSYLARTTSSDTMTHFNALKVRAAMAYILEDSNPGAVRGPTNPAQAIRDGKTL